MYNEYLVILCLEREESIFGMIRIARREPRDHSYTGKLVKDAHH